MTKKKLPTSEQIFHRIRWDPKFDASQFIIGYETRHNGLSEIAFDAFVPGGDIPWHRIWYFRTKEGIWWDRRSRLDRISSPEAPPSPLTQKEEHFAEKEESPLPTKSRPPTHKTSASEHPAFLFDQGHWKPFDSAPALEGVAAKGADKGGPVETDLTIVTWNVLAGPRDAEETRLSERIPLLSEMLLASRAVLIALQEASSRLLEYLLSQKETQKHYFVSALPEHPALSPQGQVILSRFPITRVYEAELSPQKICVLVELSTPSGVLIALTAHLTSNRQPDAPQKRQLQWRRLLDEVLYSQEAVWQNARFLLLGDFNAEENEILAWRPLFDGYDAWQEARPGEAGFTFHPEENPLARKNSLRGTPERFDRILLGPREGGWSIKEAKLLGTTPRVTEGEPPLFASDHYGLYVRASCTRAATHPSRPSPSLSPASWKDETPTHRTALVIIPPLEVWGEIQKIRKSFDKSHPRWMPHINLLYGFLPERLFPVAEELLHKTLREIEPFTLRLSQLRRFFHAGSLSVWLAPDDESRDALLTLRAKLADLFPSCAAQESALEGFTPHLTVASFAKTEADLAARRAREWQERLCPLAFAAEGVYLISRRNEGPFSARAFVPFGTPSHALPPRHRTAFALVQSTCDAVLLAPERPRSAPLLPTGSAQLGILREESDLDLVCLGSEEISRKQFFENARLLLQETPGVNSVRLIQDAFVPLLKTTFQGVAVDLVYARPAEAASAASGGEDRGDTLPLRPADLRRFDKESQLGLSSLLENQEIRQKMRLRYRENLFRELMRHIVLWAKARQVYGNRPGYLGGFSWAILVASFLDREPDEPKPLPALLQKFFTTYAEWPWPHPVALSPSLAASFSPSPREPMPILTPLAPPRNSARNLCRSTAAVLCAEWRRAAEILRTSPASAGWDTLSDALCAPLAPAKEGAVFLSFSLRAEDDFAEEAAGWLESRLPGLLVGLERALDARARPFFPTRRQDVAGAWGIALAPWKETPPPSLRSPKEAERQAREALETFLATFESAFPQRQGHLQYRWSDIPEQTT